MKRLIVLCAGDTSLHQRTHQHWTQSTREYDVAIIYYGSTSAKIREYKREADWFCQQSGPKWTLVRDFLVSQTHLWVRYDFVAFPDDDLDVSVQQWNDLFEMGTAYDLDLYQPSLVDNGADYIKHTLLVSQPQNILRYVNFVEIMTPILSRRALQRAVSKRILTDTHLRSGWGVDYALPQTILPHHKYDCSPDHPANRNTYQVAVIDAVAIVHTKPLSHTADAKKSSFYKTFQIDPEKEMQYFLQTYGAKAVAPASLRSVPVAAPYMTSLPRRTPVSTTSPNTSPGNRKGRTRPLRTDLPSYLSQNIDTEFRLLRATASLAAYTTSADIRNFYHKITFGFHARIRRNNLTVVTDFGSFESRNTNTVAMLNDVLGRYQIDDVDVLVSTDDFVRQPDIRGVPILCMAKKRAQSYVTYPDHSFYEWTEAHTRSWDEERTQLMHTACPNPRPQALFRGNLSTFYLREYLAKASQKERQIQIQRHKHRTQHQKHQKHQQHQKHTHKQRYRARATMHAPVLDVSGVHVGDVPPQPPAAQTSRKPPRRVASAAATTSASHTVRSQSAFVLLRDHAKWKYLLHIPGRSYAARLKYLLATNSVVLYVKKRDAYEYNEFWYAYLEADTNCVVINDHNAYDAHNKNVVKRNARGKKIWDDSANESIVKQIQQTVHRLETHPRQAQSLVQSNDHWRRTFDYELVLKYFGVVLNEVAAFGR